MSSKSGSVEPDSSQDKVVLLYDYSKHLLSLALFGLGGITSLAQSSQGQKIPGQVIAMILAFLAISGFCSLTCTANILRARQQDRLVGQGAWFSSRLAMMFLGISIGGFLTIWIPVLL